MISCSSAANLLYYYYANGATSVVLWSRQVIFRLRHDFSQMVYSSPWGEETLGNSIECVICSYASFWKVGALWSGPHCTIYRTLSLKVTPPSVEHWSDCSFQAVVALQHGYTKAFLQAEDGDIMVKLNLVFNALIYCRGENEGEKKLCTTIRCSILRDKVISGQRNDEEGRHSFCGFPPSYRLSRLCAC